MLCTAFSQILLGEDNSVKGIVDSTGRVTSCDIFVCSAEYLPDEYAQAKQEMLYTRVGIVDRAVLSSAERGVAIIPPNASALGNLNALHVIQLDGGMYVCPDDVVLVYLSTTASDGDDPSELLDNAMRLLCDGVDARELWHMTSRQYLVKATDITETAQRPHNLCVCGENVQQAYFNESVVQAKKLFEQVCPDAEFLPPTEVDTDEVDEETEYMQSIVESFVPAAAPTPQASHEEQKDTAVSDSETNSVAVDDSNL